MLNLLIVDDDIYYCKKLINNMSQSNFKIKLAYLATNEKEALNIINNGSINIDIVILSLDIITEPNKFLPSVSSTRNKKMEYSLIVLYNRTYELANANNTTYKYINKYDDINVLLCALSDLINAKTPDADTILVRKKIQAELEFIGYNLSYNGSRYLEETIFQLYIKRELYIDNLVKDVYPIIAKKYKKTINTVKCDIIRATDIMYCECNVDKLKKYFNFYSDTKPKPKLVAFTVLNKLDIYATEYK